MIIRVGHVLGEGKLVLEQNEEPILALHFKSLDVRSIATSWVSAVERKLFKCSCCEITYKSKII